jgi:hypothetical protein
MTRPIIISGLLLVLAACNALVAFEQRAAPVVAKACADFHSAEMSPLVRLAIVGGNIASGGVAGPVVASIQSFGDAFCSAGPPPTDATTPEQQAAWLYGVIDRMLTAAGVSLR